MLISLLASVSARQDTQTQPSAEDAAMSDASGSTVSFDAANVYQPREYSASVISSIATGIDTCNHSGCYDLVLHDDKSISEGRGFKLRVGKHVVQRAK